MVSQSLLARACCNHDLTLHVAARSARLIALDSNSVRCASPPKRNHNSWVGGGSSLASQTLLARLGGKHSLYRYPI